MKVRAGFYVIERFGRGSGEISRQAGGPGQWRIEGPVPEPHLTVDTAIRYVAELRASVKDPAIRRNADNTLAALKRLR
jgi:hypothetical protein